MAMKRYEVKVKIINELTYSVFLEEDPERSARKTGVLAMNAIRSTGDRRILDAEFAYIYSHKEMP
jgi:hypothetical protein